MRPVEVKSTSAGTPIPPFSFQVEGVGELSTWYNNYIILYNQIRSLTYSRLARVKSRSDEGSTRIPEVLGPSDRSLHLGSKYGLTLPEVRSSLSGYHQTQLGSPLEVPELVHFEGRTSQVPPPVPVLFLQLTLRT